MDYTEDIDVDFEIELIDQLLENEKETRKQRVEEVHKIKHYIYASREIISPTTGQRETFHGVNRFLKTRITPDRAVINENGLNRSKYETLPAREFDPHKSSAKSDVSPRHNESFPTGVTAPRESKYTYTKKTTQPETLPTSGSTTTLKKVESYFGAGCRDSITPRAKYFENCLMTRQNAGVSNRDPTTATRNEARDSVTERHDRIPVRNRAPPKINTDTDFDARYNEMSFPRYQTQWTGGLEKPKKLSKNLPMTHDSGADSGLLTTTQNNESSFPPDFPVKIPVLLDKLKTKQKRKRKKRKDIKPENDFFSLVHVPPIESKPSTERINILYYMQSSEDPILMLGKNASILEAEQKTLEIVRDRSSTVSFFMNQTELDPSKRFSDQLSTFPANLRAVLVPKERKPQKCHVTKGTDWLGMADDDEPLVKMSCGHVFAPCSLVQHIKFEIKNQKYQIKCPDNSHKETNGFWSLKELKEKACLSDSEQNLYEYIFSMNFINSSRTIFTCPKCHKFIDDECRVCKGYLTCISCNNSKFCLNCLTEIQNESNVCMTCRSNKTQNLSLALETCDLITIVGINNCPSVRACPSCTYVIEYQGQACKHMVCTACSCKFCFVCLRVKPEKSVYWPCDGSDNAFKPCKLAPIQTYFCDLE